MDDVDGRLVAALLANGRASYAELGRLVGMSGPSVQERVRRLEERGVITGYSAELAPGALGLTATAIIGIYLSDSADQDHVATALHELADLEACWSVAGEESFLVKVAAPDVPALERVIARLRRVPGVARTRTTVVLSTKWEGRVPVLGPDGPEDAGGPGASERSDGPAG